MTAAGHTSRVSGAHTPTAEERQLGENLTEIGKAGAAAVGGEALQAVRGTSSTGRAVSTVKNTKNASGVRVVSNPNASVVSQGQRALPGRVSTPNVRAVRSSNNVRPNTITAEGRTISSRPLSSKSSVTRGRALGTTVAVSPLVSLMLSDSNPENDVASGASVGSIISRIANRQTAIDKLLKTGNYISDENGNLVPYVPNNNSSQTPAASSPKPNYWWIKGFRNRVQGLGLKSRDDVKAIQRKLGVNADGIWGKNTEAAYINKFKFNPNTSEETIPIAQEIQPVSVVSTPTFNTQYNPNFNWREALKLHYQNPFVTSAKQGGQLTSKNPIERFKIELTKINF